MTHFLFTHKVTVLIVFTVIMASAFLTPLISVNAASVTPHRAFYEMQHGVADLSSDVQAVSGRSAFTLEKDCNGWRSNEEYVIEFGGKEGNVERILSRFESWESDTGDMYSFDIGELSSFQAAKEFSGYAEMDSINGAAHFSMANEPAMKLPANTYFPLRHLNAILDSAENGEKMLAATVFTGADPDDALLTTNTVIGSWKDEAATERMAEFGQDGFWPVHTAYFRSTAISAAPEYEIHYSMQPNGVVRRYVIDYGDFTVIANLLKLETVGERAECR